MKEIWKCLLPMLGVVSLKEKKSLLERLGLVEKEEMITDGTQTESFLEDDYMNEVFQSDYNKIGSKQEISEEEREKPEELSSENLFLNSDEETSLFSEEHQEDQELDAELDTIFEENEEDFSEALFSERNPEIEESEEENFDEEKSPLEPKLEGDEKEVMDSFVEEKENQTMKITQEAPTSLFEVEEEVSLFEEEQEEELQPEFQRPAARSEKGEFLTVKEVYEKENLQYDKKQSIFMVDAFLNALPKNLPYEVKRQSVLEILKASEMDINALLGDGHRRLKSLNTELDSKIRETDNMVSQNEAEIYELEMQIEKIKEAIRERKQKQRVQKEEYEYETQKIEDILRFVHPEE